MNLNKHKNKVIIIQDVEVLLLNNIEMILIWIVLIIEKNTGIQEKNFKYFNNSIPNSNDV